MNEIVFFEGIKTIEITRTRRTFSAFFWMKKGKNTRCWDRCTIVCVAYKSGNKTLHDVSVFNPSGVKVWNHQTPHPRKLLYHTNEKLRDKILWCGESYTDSHRWFKCQRIHSYEDSARKLLDK